MWVIIELDDLSVFTIISVLSELKRKDEHVILSFNSSKSYDETIGIIETILQECRTLNLDVSVGPIFLEDEVIVGNHIVVVNELFIASIVDKAKWCLENVELTSSVNTIVMISAILGIEPLAISQKIAKEDDKYNFEFYYNELLIDGIASLVDNKHFKFERMRRR